MRRKIAVICGAILLAGVLLGGCSSVASGTVRTTAAVEVSQETKTAEPVENSDTTQGSADSKTGGEKPHVVLQQNETESSETETEPVDPYADLLKEPEVMAANKIYAKETAEKGKTRIVFAGDILLCLYRVVYCKNISMSVTFLPYHFLHDMFFRSLLLFRNRKNQLFRF